MKKFLAKNNISGSILFFYCFLIWIPLGAFLLGFENDRSIYREINQQHTVFLDLLMPYVSYLGTGPVIIFISLLLLGIKKFRNWQFLILALVVNGIPFLVAQVLKNIFHAPRPLKYFEQAEWIHLVPGQRMHYHLSFPSGHSEGAFACFCFLALLLPRKYALFGLFLFLLALLVMYSRIYLSQHFFADVYAGSLIGGLGALFCFLLMKYFFRRKEINKTHPQNA